MKLKLCVVSAIVAVLGFTACDEESGPSRIPTIPTAFELEDGAVVRESELMLSVSGSTVESSEEIHYRYYLGTSLDDMSDRRVSYSGSASLYKPYAQYFWYAVAETKGGKGEPSPIKTFYYVPDFNADLRTDNGEDESAIVVSWKAETLEGVLDYKVSLEPETEGVKCEKNIVPVPTENAEVRSLSILADDDYVTYSQDWDDKNGIYYEPIKYKVRLVADIKVGDKVVEAFSEPVEEIFLDKSKMVRDRQFNVYRVAKIGNYIWMVDDFRYIVGDFYKCKEVTLKSGQKGVLYDPNLPNREIFPKGFDMPHQKHWDDLLSTIGAGNEWTVIGREGDPYPAAIEKREIINKFAQNYESIRENPKIRDYYNNINYDKVIYKYQEADVFNKLSSQYGWYNPEDNSEIEGISSIFNAKPYGMINGEDNYSINSAAFYSSRPFIIGIWANNKGVCKVRADAFFNGADEYDENWSPIGDCYSKYWYFSARGVKDIE